MDSKINQTAQQPTYLRPDKAASAEAMENTSQMPGQQVDQKAGLDSLLLDDASINGLQELVDKIEPLLAGGRLTRIVDLLSVTADMVDMTDAYMVEKLARAVEDVTAAAWTTGNAARMAREQVSAMPEPPTLIGLLRMAREPEVRRGLSFMLAMAGVLGKGMPHDNLDYTQD